MKTFKTSRLLSSPFETRFYFPDQIIVTESAVKILRKKWLGLMKNEDRILIDRIASVRLQENFFGFGAKLSIETQGGAKKDLIIPKLRKKVGKKLRDTLEEGIE